jgi:osmotically-inducible protein OsmY
MRIIRISAGAMLLAFAMGCGNTADGVQEDTAKAVENTAKVAEATTDALGGALETASVKAAIIADPRVGARDINVSTDEAAKTVTLDGTVLTAEQKRVAGEIAASKATGYTIVNSLVIRSAP